MRWLVKGAEAMTGQDVTREVEADTQAQAEQMARRAGLMIESVEPRPDQPPVDTYAEFEHTRPMELVMIGVMALVAIGCLVMFVGTFRGMVLRDDQVIRPLYLVAALLCGVIICLIRLRAVIRAAVGSIRNPQ